ncbi:hypothetical protein [Bacillus cereus]|uniref:Uncharacterized protein n=1 Tax=Bacillus cereus 03BB108 TaxID=451709 RepID=A0AAN0SSU1_BACCE|nr:hypothetical protein [Bacillus cereus]AJI09083.1 hypothetical protein AK40_6124 [Bacillus cereus 03BB108]MBJ6722271.1 hypothetical protein [Bacillus sp. PR5]QKG98687.1 hypothetical protein FOC96_00065 [Bacillus cereus]
MSEVILSDTAKFKITKIHNDIVEKYLQMHPEYKTKADVFRRAIGLLDEDMRKERGEDDLSLLKKEVINLTQSVNTMKQQMDVLIKLNMELISRSGTDLSIEEMQQEVKKKIGAAVTKKSEGNFSRNSNRVSLETKKEETVQQEIEVQNDIKSTYKTDRNLPMITDDEEILLVNDKPHKKIWKFNRQFNEEIKWEQIPEHRLNELK